MSGPPPMEGGVVVRRGAGGVALSVPLLRLNGPDTLRAALQLGFSSALVFDAGLAVDDNGGWLLLSRWVEGGQDGDAPAIAAARAALLEQRASWLSLLPGQEAGAPRQGRPGVHADAGLEARQRQRLQGLLVRTSP